MARRIFYYCYDHNRAAGGEKHSYQHVDLLNLNGFEAYAYHRSVGTRLTWFDNDTRVADEVMFAKLYNPERDILVFPEDLGPYMFEYPGRRVIFNKNVFHGFSALKFASRDPFLDPATMAIFAVSEDNEKYLRTAYPTVPLYRVYAHIRRDIFTPKPFHEKSRRIVSAAKALPMLTSLYRMFTARASKAFNRGDTWEWLILSGRTERETASILTDSALCVVLNVEEGLPRLPLEAMCCGCLVAAFRSGPLVEILPIGHGFDYADLTSMLKWIEQVVETFPQNTSAYADLLCAQQKSAARFSESKQVESVCAAWEQIFHAM